MIGGDFSQVDGLPNVRVARVNLDGSVDRTTLPGILGQSGANGTVNALAVYPTTIPNLGGRTIVAGAFTTFNGVNLNRYVRLAQDGSIDSTFTIGAGADNPIYAVAIQRTGM